jgi:sulfite dehydrogenase (quinone) subunit SoeA
VRGFQSVLLDLGARMGLPGMTDTDGTPLYRDYADYMVHHERAPGVGLLAGWRGEDGSETGKGAPNPQQLQRYIEHGGFWHAPIPESARYYKMANRDYLQWAHRFGFIATTDAIVLQLYSETLQKFRLAAQGHGALQPPDEHRERVATYFDPLPLWYEPFESAQLRMKNTGGYGDGGLKRPQERVDAYPLSAITQRPMFMYHAWGSQNAWLRQITARNYLYLHPDTGARFGIVDEDWIEVSSHHGTITVQAKFARNMQPDTVWTWNAIGKRKGAWKLAKNAPEAEQGFLLNHLISDITPRGDYANAGVVRSARLDPQGRYHRHERAAVFADRVRCRRRCAATLRRDNAQQGPRMSTAHPTGRRIAGWTCIALGKIGSLLLLWAFISGAEPDVGNHASNADVLFGMIGIAPLLAMTLGAVVIGVWILLKSERT